MNYRELRTKIAMEGYNCEGDTDTEVIAKLAMRLHDQDPTVSFHELACALVSEFTGAFSFLMKSRHYPDEIIAVKKGSPLVIGLTKQEHRQPESIHVQLPPKTHLQNALDPPTAATKAHRRGNDLYKSDNSATSHKQELGPTEFFLASDPAAIIKYTNKMIYLEDDDVVHINCGSLRLYNPNAAEKASTIREVQTVENLDGKIPIKAHSVIPCKRRYTNNRK